jgi:UTP--glucose-1-phosphate uridylyltransferase
VKTTKAVITAAARNQRTLPLQTLVDRDGIQKSVLCIILEEALRAGIEDICLIICPGDESGYREAAGEHAERLRFVCQAAPLGYGHAVWCARDFVGQEPFLHMIGDHIYVSQDAAGCAQQLIEIASGQSCSASGVQSTREGLLPYFGAVGGQRIPGAKDLYLIERVLEKPTPTEAEQKLLIPGLRTGHYLCFFGMHVFTPTVMELLDDHVRARGEQGGIQLSPVLAELAVRERYLALEAKGRRYPVDARYGLLTAQIALALSGHDRNEVLALVCELLAQREMDR